MWNRCEQEMRTQHGASSANFTEQFVQQVMQINQQAFERCSSSGLRKGTLEFAYCSAQAQTNIANQSAQERNAADLQQAIAQAQADAKRERDTDRLIGISLRLLAPPAQRSFHCNQIGTITHCN